MDSRFGFLTTLCVKKTREAGSDGRGTWQLLTALWFMSESYGLVTVPAGFETDFASVPRAPFAFWLTGATAEASAVVHDYLIREHYPDRITWPEAAAVFREAMVHEGVPAWRRALMHWAVLGADPANTWSET